MQTNMTDKNISKSVKNLDRQRLFANIYENIHGLASLLGINDQLVNPVKDISNKPQCKLWKGYENYLLNHIWNAYDYWFVKYANKATTTYFGTINWENISKIAKTLKILSLNLLPTEYPDWCSEECIKTHRLHLISKNKEIYIKKWPELYDEYLDEFIKMSYNWHD